MKKPPAHDWWTDQVMQLAAGELTGSEALEIKRHLADCEMCTEVYQDYQNAAELLTEGEEPASVKAPPLPPALVARWEQEAREQHKTKKPQEPLADPRVSRSRRPQVVRELSLLLPLDEPTYDTSAQEFLYVEEGAGEEATIEEGEEEGHQDSSSPPAQMKGRRPNR